MSLDEVIGKVGRSASRYPGVS